MVNAALKEKYAAMGNMQRAFSPGLEDAWEKNDLQDVVYWLRQVFAIVIGLIFGLVPLMGSTGIIGYVAVNWVFLTIYTKKYLGIEAEDLGLSSFELVQEGFMVSFSLFIVVWTITYNAVILA